MGDADLVKGPTLYPVYRLRVYRLRETADGLLVCFAASNDGFLGRFRALVRSTSRRDPRPPDCFQVRTFVEVASAG